MQTPLAIVLTSAVALAACAAAVAQDETRAAPSPPAQSWSWPDSVQNAQILPEDTGGEQLRGVMMGFVRGLGVRCSFCHVGSGPDLSSYDFVSDANDHKNVARAMFRMTREINDEQLAHIEGHEDGRVTCFTCHRGTTHPLTRAPDDASD